MTTVMTWLRRLTQKSERRPRVVLACVVAVCVAITGIAVTGAGSAPSGLKFAQAGHWIYNSVLGTAFHLDGGSKSVDAEVPIAGLGPGAAVVQTDENGYVLSREGIVEFGKSDLAVADPIEPPANEQPVVLEAAGAAYAVYRKAGIVVRFGEQMAVQAAEGPLGPPVLTRTGTLWVHRLQGRRLCQLTLQATRMSCTATTPNGHTGGLALVGDQPMFVDTTSDTMTTVSDDGLGRELRLGVDLPGNAVVAANDLQGRIAVLDPEAGAVHLVDAAAAIQGEVVDPPTSTRLAPGRYEQIASTGRALGLIEEDSGTLVTVDGRGEVRKQEKLRGPSRLVRGEDQRLYVDSARGDHVMVVEGDGEITPVEVNGGPEDDATPTASPTPTTTPTTRPTARPTNTPRPTPTRTAEPTPRRRSPEPEPEPTRSREPVPASRPGAPSGVAGTAGTGRITVTWKAASGNGSPVTAYELSWSGGSTTVSGSRRKATITGLRNGTTYRITVRAVNRAGAGPGVSTKPLRPGGPAGAPANFTVEPISSDRHMFTWDKPNLYGGRLVEYRLVRDNGENTKTPDTNSQDWGGLIDGKEYHFTVQAITMSPSGKLLVGKPASLTFTADYSSLGPTITVSKGASTDYNDDCQADDGCAFVEFRAEGLEPNTEYTYRVYGSDWGEFNGATLASDENGVEHQDDRFASNPQGQEVWIVAEGPDGETIESNHFTWPAP